MKRLLSFCGYALFRLIIFALKSNKIEKAQRRGRRLGILIWHLDPKWKKIAERQIKDHMPQQNARRLCKKNYEHYGMLLAEIASHNAIIKQSAS